MDRSKETPRGPAGFRPGFAPYPQIRRLYRLYPLAGSCSRGAISAESKAGGPLRHGTDQLERAENKAAKAQKYKLSNQDEPVLTFTSFNFKLAVMEVLMYEKGLLAPKLDAHEFAREYSRRKIDIERRKGMNPSQDQEVAGRNTLSRSG